jgi:hypothetical protein
MRIWMTHSRCRNIYGSAPPINLSRKILSPTPLLTFSLTEPADSNIYGSATPINLSRKILSPTSPPHLFANGTGGQSRPRGGCRPHFFRFIRHSGKNGASPTGILSFSRAEKINVINKKPQYSAASVGDPDTEPDRDPHVFGPPGSVSICQRYGSRIWLRLLPLSHKCVEWTEIMFAK